MKINFKELGSRFKKEKVKPKNWFRDRYQLSLVQRNSLYLLTIIVLLASTAYSFVAYVLTQTKEVKPYILQVSEQTGAVKTIKASTIRKSTQEEAIYKYFITKYIRAIEGRFGSYDYSYQDTLRDLSNGSFYQSNIHTGDAVTDIRFKDIFILPQRKLTPEEIETGFVNNDFTAEAKFMIIYASKPVEHKVATINFTMAREQGEWLFLVNPVGFKVTGYMLHDEVI